MKTENEVYLLRLILDPRNREVQRDLSNCQNLHRTLMSAFPQAGSEAARQEFGLLYRVEPFQKDGRWLVRVLVQSQLDSQQPPDWTRLPSGYLADENDNPACKAVTEKYATLQNDMRLRFRLRANPTRKIVAFDKQGAKKKNGQRVDIRGEGNQIDWLVRKSEAHGFRLLSVCINEDVPNVCVAPENKITGWRKDRNSSPLQAPNENEPPKLTFGSVLFEGVLEIIDVEQFQKMLKTGIGSGKAYGFGLLSIAHPVSV